VNARTVTEDERRRIREVASRDLRDLCLLFFVRETGWRPNDPEPRVRKPASDPGPYGEKPL